LNAGELRYRYMPAIADAEASSKTTATMRRFRLVKNLLNCASPAKVCQPDVDFRYHLLGNQNGSHIEHTLFHCRYGLSVLFQRRDGDFLEVFAQLVVGDSNKRAKSLNGEFIPF